MSDDGWIEWKGGACPVQMPQVQVRYREGEEIVFPLDSISNDGEWQHEKLDPAGDIIAYRVVQS